MLTIIKNLDKEKIIAKVKPLVIIAVCMAVIFIAGFGAGKMRTTGNENPLPNKRSFTNYNTNTTPKDTKTSNPEGGTKIDANKNSDTTLTSNCQIKGSKSKIYHVPGGSFYDRTNPTQCFATEEDAEKAGYTKSSR